MNEINKSVIKLELFMLLKYCKQYKEYLEDKKTNVQLFQVYKALSTAVFWLEVYLK